MAPARKRNLIYILILPAVLFCLFSLPRKSASADTEYGPIAYLDYVLSSPETIYADEDVIAVSSESGTVFFYNGNIYETDILMAKQQLVRSGNYIYYTFNSKLMRVETGSFNEETVRRGDDSEITANAFALSGKKLLVLTNPNALLYEDFTSSAASSVYAFEGYDLPVFGNVYFAGEDIYAALGGKLFKNGAEIYDTGKNKQIADYFTDISGTVYFSGEGGIYKLSGNTPVLVYENPEGGKVRGLSAFDGGLLFIDAAKSKIMQMDANGKNVKEYRFDVSVETEATLPEPDENVGVVTVKAGARVHYGNIESGAFVFENTETSCADEDFVLLSEQDGYYVLLCENGYAFTAKENAGTKEQNAPITFEKGYILHKCNAYSTIILNEGYKLFTLEKGAEVAVKKVYDMNGKTFILVEADGEKAFVSGGEIAENLIPPLSGDGIADSYEISVKDNSLAAGVIIIASAGLLVIALFIILVKKEYIKF